jgi:hypothetical protein
MLCTSKILFTLGSLAVAVAQSAPALATLCPERAPRITAAFVRRWARDTGNLLAAQGTDAVLIGGMSQGMPSGTSVTTQTASKARRLWSHTEDKIHRKCTDAEAGHTYPGDGATTAGVVDDLFNDYAIPWASAVRSLTGPYGERCTQYAFIQAGYAARDYIRDGADEWARYQKLVDRVCPPGLFEEVKDVTSIYLFQDLGELRQAAP